MNFNGINGILMELILKNSFHANNHSYILSVHGFDLNHYTTSSTSNT